MSDLNGGYELLTWISSIQSSTRSETSFEETSFMTEENLSEVWEAKIKDVKNKPIHHSSEKVVKL